MTLIKALAVSTTMAACLSILLACGDAGPGSGEGSSNQPPRPALMPADPELAAIYQRSCKSCHGIGVTNIPQTGDVEAWQPRLAKGMDGLMDSVIDGFGGMPPLGMCMDCDTQEFQALITFMSGLADDGSVEGQSRD